MSGPEQPPAVAEDSKKPTKIADLLPKEDDVLEDEELLAQLQDADGKLKVDTSLPASYELEVQAAMLLEHLSAFSQADQQWRAARNQSDHQRATRFFEERNFHRLTAAIVEARYPGAKALADTLANTKVSQLKQQRKTLAEQAEKEGGS